MNLKKKMNGEVGTWTNNYIPRETMYAITMPRSWYISDHFTNMD